MMKQTHRGLEQTGNGYDHHHHHHHHHHQHHNHNHSSIHDQKSLFLPMFCRLSIKDVKVNNHYKDPISATAAVDPSSPKVSCIGQVKRNNRVIGFPPPTTTAAGHHKHSKPKPIFSSKTLFPKTTTAATTTVAGGGRNGPRSSRTSKEMCASNSRKPRKSNCDNHFSCPLPVVDIAEMDPPLPVVKRVAPPGVGRDEVNIWKRRFNGEGLKSLQIEQIHSPKSRFETLPITTV